MCLELKVGIPTPTAPPAVLLGKRGEANRCGGRGSISPWSCLSTQDDVYYFGQRWATGGLIMRDTLFLTTKAVKDHPRATHCHPGDE